MIFSLEFRQDITEPPEDDASIAAHLLALQRECLKTHRNSTLIAEKMVRTISHRTQLAMTESISAVLEKYPCLKFEHEVSIIAVTISLSNVP